MNGRITSCKLDIDNLDGIEQFSTTGTDNDVKMKKKKESKQLKTFVKVDYFNRRCSPLLKLEITFFPNWFCHSKIIFFSIQDNQYI